MEEELVHGDEPFGRGRRANVYKSIWKHDDVEQVSNICVVCKSVSEVFMYRVLLFEGTEEENNEIAYLFGVLMLCYSRWLSRSSTLTQASEPFLLPL